MILSPHGPWGVCGAADGRAHGRPGSINGKHGDVREATQRRTRAQGRGSHNAQSRIHNRMILPGGVRGDYQDRTEGLEAPGAVVNLRTGEAAAPFWKPCPSREAGA
ncbi:hypothetical protein NDU88_005252 [Pleurodeles waltl]|uniref:Uncharacterized protein n=1 Tax=Pleurodeles waltl TaxID=8319 RepID=A0AAV7WC61_PLEWA|nr:hypothetical protein NDU88_005252 [Pleurodeles waltl]